MAYQIEHEVDEFKFILETDNDGEIIECSVFKQNEIGSDYDEIELEWDDLDTRIKNILQNVAYENAYEQAMSEGRLEKCDETGDISIMPGGLDD